MRPSARAININAYAQRVEVDNRISLHYYHRIADNLLKQASIYRQEKNLIDFYIILLRFSSLMCETIPLHRDYQAMLPKEKSIIRKKLLDALNELESLKPAIQRQVDEFNTGHFQSDALERISSGTTPTKKRIFPSSHIEQAPIRSTSQLSWKPSNEWSHDVALDHMHTERRYQRLTHGIFHLSDPSGVSVIRNCQERGFHPHEEPSDGSPIYEHCSHVYMNLNLKFDVIDLRNS